MAEVKEEDVEYESDPEEAKLSLKMRRREASDDDEEAEEDDFREKPTRRIDSEGEDGQGGVDEYEEGFEDEEDYVEEEEIEEYEGLGEEEGEGRLGSDVAVGHVEDKVEEGMAAIAGELHQGLIDDGGVKGDQAEGERKENEPFAVPTAGAFYMHDDRFRDNAGGRNRRTFGGRKLWELKDDRKWGHDKFEELTMEERPYEEGIKASRGRYRGRGRSRGPDHGYQRGRRHKAYNDRNYNSDINQNQNNAPRGVRGRGPRRYRPSFKYNEARPVHSKQSETPAHNGSEKSAVPVSNEEMNEVSAGKQVFMSSLNSASPPFYPSSSSSKDSLLQKRDIQQTGTVARSVQPSSLGGSFAGRSNTNLRGKNVIDSIGIEKLTITDPFSSSFGRPPSNLQMPLSGNPLTNSTQPQELRAQGRGITASRHLNYQSTQPQNKVSPLAPSVTVQRSSVQSRGQPLLQASGQQLPHRLGGGSLPSPPKTAQSLDTTESGEWESSSESSKSKVGLVGKGKTSFQGNGRGAVLYGGTQVMGGPATMHSGQGDQNFPAFLPVMQFGGQHPGGMGVPAVGMAFPGYVAQPQLGLGNSEMTWLPVLAGAAGALGASYCPPYIAVDGSYSTRPSAQISSSKEINTNQPNNEGKPAERPELTNDDLGQRQKNPRRYTEMKFDQ